MFKFSKSLIKILLPMLFKILIKLKINRRVINFLHEKSYNSNSKYNFTSLLEMLLEKNKKKFISLMLIFGQLKLLQIILKRFEIKYEELEKIEDQYFN